jgi:hypothetical protein
MKLNNFAQLSLKCHLLCLQMINIYTVLLCVMLLLLLLCMLKVQNLYFEIVYMTVLFCTVFPFSLLVVAGVINELICNTYPSMLR